LGLFSKDSGVWGFFFKYVAEVRGVILCSLAYEFHQCLCFSPSVNSQLLNLVFQM